MENSWYNPVENSWYNPVENSWYNPVENSWYNPVENSWYNPVENSWYNPVENSRLAGCKGHATFLPPPPPPRISQFWGGSKVGVIEKAEVCVSSVVVIRWWFEFEL